MTNIKENEGGEIVHKEPIYDELLWHAYEITEELCKKAKLCMGQILVVGCSTSEIDGKQIGSNSHIDIAEAVFFGIYKATQKNGIWLAAQCCEHLNRAIIIEKKAIQRVDIVNVVPQPNAGGAFAAITWKELIEPVAVEEIKADAGIDIGDTLIGMHLKKVAVPVRLNRSVLGKAHVNAARVRPKYIGGSRASYNESLL